jgi:hypothetical protein
VESVPTEFQNSLEAVLENISGNLGVPLAPINRFVVKVKDSLSSKSHVFLDELDNLANGFLKAKVELGALMDHLTSPDLIDAFWEFFAADMPESQLVRIDDYDYNCVFVQSPFWTSLLLTKLGVPPPPVLVRHPFEL